MILSILIFAIPLILSYGSCKLVLKFTDKKIFRSLAFIGTFILSLYVAFFSICIFAITIE